MYDDRHLAGIGGWLAFFWISNTFLAPIGIAMALYGNIYADPALPGFYGSSWPLVQAGELTIAALSLAGCWYLSWRLMKVETWQTVRIVIAGIWLIGLGPPILEGLLIAVTGKAALAALLPFVLGGVVRTLVVGSLWTAYFLRSRRVANTYPRQADQGEMEQIFS